MSRRRPPDHVPPSTGGEGAQPSDQATPHAPGPISVPNAGMPVVRYHGTADGLPPVRETLFGQDSLWPRGVIPDRQRGAGLFGWPEPPRR